MTRHLENVRIVGEFVRARLVLECRVRGRAAQISREVGMSPIHISRVIRNESNVGSGLAKAMAKVWGIEYETLEKMAFEAHRLPLIPAESKADELPNLQKTIDWCHHEKIYPPGFLRAYERDALKEFGSTDRAAREWMLDLEAKFKKYEEVRQKRAKEVDAARRMSAREERSGTFAKHGESQGDKRGAAKTPRAAS